MIDFPNGQVQTQRTATAVNRIVTVPPWPTWERNRALEALQRLEWTTDLLEQVEAELNDLPAA